MSAVNAMRRLVLVFVVFAGLTGFFPGHVRAFEFDNAAAEAFFQTRVRGAIKAEYSSALAEMDAQAKAAGTAVERDDVQRLTLWMVQKAFLYGVCFDRAVSANSERGTIDVTAYSVGCLKEGLQIADQIERKAWAELLRAARSVPSADEVAVNEDAVRVCTFGLGSDSLRALTSKHIFEFLLPGQEHVYVYDLHRLRDCIVRVHAE